jgi:hypothetical protein
LGHLLAGGYTPKSTCTLLYQIEEGNMHPKHLISKDITIKSDGNDGSPKTNVRGRLVQFQSFKLWVESGIDEDAECPLEGWVQIDPARTQIKEFQTPIIPSVWEY